MVNSFTEERQAIEVRFNNCFNNYETPVQYDNISYLKKGDQVLSDSSKTNEWVRLSIIGADANSQEIGSKRTRFTGLIVCSVFVRENTGSNSARDIADSLFDVFNGALFEGIQCQATRITQIPPTDGWFQMQLETDFYWDRCPCP